MTIDEAIDSVNILIEFCRAHGYDGQSIRLIRIRNCFVDLRDRANDDKD